MTNSRDFSDSQRETIWKKYFGYSDSGIDAFGRNVRKSDFECDHVYPKSRGGKTVIENGMPLNPTSNEEKSDNLSGNINGKSFNVKGNVNHGILYVEGIQKSK